MIEVIVLIAAATAVLAPLCLFAFWPFIAIYLSEKTEHEDDQIVRGLVVNKKIIGSYTNDNGTTIYEYPEKFMLELQIKEDDNLFSRYTQEVTAEEYAKYNIGDYYGHE